MISVERCSVVHHTCGPVSLSCLDSLSSRCCIFAFSSTEYEFGMGSGFDLPYIDVMTSP